MKLLLLLSMLVLLLIDQAIPIHIHIHHEAKSSEKHVEIHITRHTERERYREREERVRHRERERMVFAGLVLTESGQLCHFPFYHGRIVHHTCIRNGRARPWCSLTRNFDKDKLWSFCVEGSKITDHCENNPCEPRGICENTLNSYNCVCHEPYTGNHCKKDKCFDEMLQKYFDIHAKWLRYKSPNLEECTCGERGTVCRKTPGKHCSDNLCLHGGHCMQSKNDKVCGCTQGYMGPHCEINKNENCLTGNATSYRGTVKVTMTGTPCLNWESDIIRHEVSLYSGHQKKHGIGSHSYCRSPDGDAQPWCFIQKNEVLSWEHCDIPRCHQPAASPGKPSHSPSPTVSKPQAPTKKPQAPTKKPQAPTKKPQAPTKKPPAPTKKPPAPTKKPQAPITKPPPTQASNDPVKSTVPPTRNVSRAITVECGKRFLKSPSITPRIVGGLVALPASHPYMAAIYIGDLFCGGSLISSCWVVTASHCLDNRPNVNSITVELGQSRFNTTDQRTVKFKVNKYIIHEDYSEYTYQNDIALVRLQDVNGECAQFTQFIQPVCLPKSTMTATSAQHCEVVGWGHQYFGADHYASYLQEAHVPILSNAQCQSPLAHGNKIMDGMMCAGFMEGGVDACQGDSGGPLVCEVDSKVHLFGVVSWGSGCAEENKPGVYTDVSKYTEWILTNID